MSMKATAIPSPGLLFLTMARARTSPPGTSKSSFTSVPTGAGQGVTEGLLVPNLVGGAKIPLYQALQSLGRAFGSRCLSPIILSPLNGQVKMSPHEQGDILIESERVATSGGDFSMYQGRGGVCQSRRAALLERAPDQALEETSARRRGGGSGTRQSRPA